MDRADPAELDEAYQKGLALGLPVVYGEVADRVETNLARMQAGEEDGRPGELSDPAVYHFYPSLEQARQWIAQAGLRLVEEAFGSGYHHFLAVKPEGGLAD
jgi:hypothetical protein